jgi:hypothetical protein
MRGKVRGRGRIGRRDGRRCGARVGDDRGEHRVRRRDQHVGRIKGCDATLARDPHARTGHGTDHGEPQRRGHRDTEAESHAGRDSPARAIRTQGPLPSCPRREGRGRWWAPSQPQIRGLDDPYRRWALPDKETASAQPGAPPLGRMPAGTLSPALQRSAVPNMRHAFTAASCIRRIIFASLHGFDTSCRPCASSSHLR